MSEREDSPHSFTIGISCSVYLMFKVIDRFSVGFHFFLLIYGGFLYTMDINLLSAFPHLVACVTLVYDVFYP